MKHRGACAPSLALRGFFARMCAFPAVRYVPIAGIKSRVRTPGSWAKFVGFRSTTEHQYTESHTARPSRAHLRSTLRNQHLSEDGRMDAMDKKKKKKEDLKRGKEGRKAPGCWERLGALETRKVTDHAYGNFRFRLDKSGSA
ncbi:hypothetical protein FQN60_003603 [Etheostoma spectabile]|uniref:Uncharacterized protein n=1 Tax=Etheostoma spectabile TaxID=54343 RepID=A0A5J5CUX1_9PERO|nr:hypothetical protein FQN60_003603 [Etheostoma spectabile]